MSDLFPHYLKRACVAEFRKMGFHSTACNDLAQEVLASFDALPMDKKASFAAGGPALAGAAASGLAGKISGIGLGVLGATLAGGAILGLARLSKAVVNNPIQASKFREALEQAIMKEPRLRMADRTVINAMAATIFRYAPNAAADANILASILVPAIESGGLDVKTIDMLTNLETRYSGNQQMPIKNYVVK